MHLRSLHLGLTLAALAGAWLAPAVHAQCPPNFTTPTNFAVGSTPLFVAVGDFNGDGRLDLAVANFSSNSVSILLGTGSGSFGAATNFTVGTNPYSIAAGDFNGDGKLDLAVANGHVFDIEKIIAYSMLIAILDFGEKYWWPRRKPKPRAA